MTNSIKMFKIKLRSLNTPKLLYWLNVGVVLMVIIVLCCWGYLWLAQHQGMDRGEIYFEKAVESTWVIDGVMMAKLYNLQI